MGGLDSFFGKGGGTNWASIVGGVISGYATYYAANQQKKMQEQQYKQQQQQYQDQLAFQQQQLQAARSTPAALMAPYLMETLIKAYGGKLSKYGINLPVEEMLGALSGGQQGGHRGTGNQMNATAYDVTGFDTESLIRSLSGLGGGSGRNRIENRSYEGANDIGGEFGGSVDFDIFASMQDPNYFRTHMVDSLGRIGAEQGGPFRTDLNPSFSNSDWERMGAGLSAQDVWEMNQAMKENSGMNKENIIWSIIQQLNPMNLAFSAVRRGVSSPWGVEHFGIDTSPNVMEGFMTQGTGIPYYGY